jgi:hypothetical protein
MILDDNGPIYIYLSQRSHRKKCYKIYERDGW